MGKSPFRPCWAKLARAKEHRDELGTFMLKFDLAKGNKPIVRAKLDAASGEHVFRIAYIPQEFTEYLESISLRLGDIIHNLRAALDYLAYQLALAEAKRAGTRLTAQSRTQIYFPIHSRRSGPRIRGRSPWSKSEHIYVGQFGRAATDVIERFQPYHGRKGKGVMGWSGRFTHPLTVLRRLENRDKHRLPNVIAAVPNGFQMAFPAESPWGLPFGFNFRDYESLQRRGEEAIRWHERIFRYSKMDVRLGAEVMRYHLEPDAPEVQMAGTLSPNIRLPGLASVKGESDRIARFVLTILSEFDTPPQDFS